MKTYSRFFIRTLSGALFCATVTMLGMAVLAGIFVAFGTLSHYAFSEELTIGAVFGACTGVVIWGWCIKPERAMFGTCLFYALPYLVPFVIRFAKRYVETPTSGELAMLVSMLVLAAGLGAAVGYFTAKMLPVLQSRVAWLD